MTRHTGSWALALLFGMLVLHAGASFAAPSVYPTGTTIYDPDQTWNGYTVFVLPESGAVLVDMNGNEVRRWDQFAGVGGGPVRMLPGGHVVGAIGTLPPHQESVAVAQYDWANELVRKFDRAEQVTTRAGETIWAARQHHDWQRADFPAGYYSPAFTPGVVADRMLILAHKNLANDAVSRHRLEDDWLYEVSADGAIVWQWHASDHVDELGFSAEARAVIHDNALFNEARGGSDWLHVNSATWLGPNRWYDAGDARFHPDNVIISAREANIIAIVARDGAIVWRLGPDYRETAATQALGQIVGQHHPHFIPQGLPGAGNLLVFDNGGTGGYGFANPIAPEGRGAVRRHFSRVLEIDPVTLEKVWEYALVGQESYRFFSHYVSAAQRLPNGNTLITEGADGRVFEVTADGKIVWEYVSPYFGDIATGTNRVYRAYRLPYEWVPQLARPVERAVVPPDVREFRIAPR
ncbi:MAG TPA: aryl-sulfate sulfotransferase [Gammaproteobacteria bacterium]|nr:aryl-sulfate sulfotransferase [Gammaproteobacteria bacterium]